MRIDPQAWLAATAFERNEQVNAVARNAIELPAESERGVVVYSAFGPEDRAHVTRAASTNGNDEATVRNDAMLASVLGTGLGRIVRHVFEQTALRRAIIASADTSGYATRSLEAESLEIILPLVPAGAVCRLSSIGNSRIDRAEVMLKGGQVGNRELFEIVRMADTTSGVAR